MNRGEFWGLCRELPGGRIPDLTVYVALTIMGIRVSWVGGGQAVHHVFT